MKRALVLCLLASVCSAGLAVAQSREPIPAATQYLLQRLTNSATLNNYLQAMRHDFSQLDADRDGEIKMADVAVHSNITGAMTSAMVAMTIMRADLDGDGAVTEGEMRQMLIYERRVSAPPLVSDSQGQELIDRQVREFMAADTNHDGRISYSEAIAFSKTSPMGMGRDATNAAMANRVRAILALAPEGKDALTLADLEIKAEAFFRTVDADGNGTVSTDEIKAYRAQPSTPGSQVMGAAEQAAKQRQERQRAAEAERIRKEQEKRAGCEMPKASDAAKVIVLSAYEGEALSATTIGSQDVATRTGTVEVEGGNEPLYVMMISFRATIWRFSGAVERIERVVMTGHSTGPGGAEPGEPPLVGLTGIAKERVTFLAKTGCMGYFTETPSSQAAFAAAAVRRETGKEPAVMSGHYGVSGFQLPSGKIESTRDERGGRGTLVIRKSAGTLLIEGGGNVVVESGRLNDLRSELMRFYPGGIVDVDPATVVSSRPAERYDILPNQAGLLQLVQNGSLKQNRGGEFLIQKKIRFPAELNGAHSAKFLLLRGVPEPDGSPGHSCVISEETGAPLNNLPTCH